VWFSNRRAKWRREEKVRCQQHLQRRLNPSLAVHDGNDVESVGDGWGMGCGAEGQATGGVFMSDIYHQHHHHLQQQQQPSASQQQAQHRHSSTAVHRSTDDSTTYRYTK